MITHWLVALRLLTSLQTVDEPYQRFAAAYASLDAERVSQLYTADAILMAPAGDIKRGRGAIRERYADGFESDRNRTRDGSGHEERFRGKFLKVWRREADGVWRIRVDSYSRAPNG